MKPKIEDFASTPALSLADLLIGVEGRIGTPVKGMLKLKERECDGCKEFALTWGDTYIIEDLIDDETDDKINTERGLDE